MSFGVSGVRVGRFRSLVVVGATALAVTGAGLVGTPSGAFAATPAAPSVSTSAPTPGVTVTVSGKLTPAAKRPVVLQTQVGWTWVQVATATTTTKGAYKFSFIAPGSVGNMVVRVTAKAGTFKVGGKTKKLAALTSKTRTLTVKAPAAPTVSTTAPAAGATVAVSGTLAPAVKRTVTLQTQVGWSWTTVATATTSATGAYSFKYTMAATSRQAVLRVTAKAGSYKVGGKSEKLPALTTGTRTLTVPVPLPVPTSAERSALVDLYNATNGASWTINSGWNTSATPCSWYGVTCNLAGRVVSLNLSSDHLSGSLPSSLGNLTNLQNLILWGNQLSGSIPTALGNLTALTDLELNGNQLSGSIPTVLGSLTNLTTLGLSSNQLSGSIPATLGSLTNLQSLDLSYNQLSGSIPATLGSLAKLQSLNLGYNQLSGAVPDSLAGLTGLTVVGLAGQGSSSSGQVVDCLTADATTTTWLNRVAPGWSNGCSVAVSSLL